LGDVEPAPVRIDTRELGRRDLRGAARLAEECFVEGPFFTFLMPSEPMRRRFLRVSHHAVVAHPGPGAYLRTVRGHADAIESVALWLPPGSYPQSVGTQLAQLPAGLRASYRRPRSIRDSYAYLKATTQAHPTEAHWYLQLLMTDPALQGRGLGTALMNDALARVDEQGVGSSLETQNEANLAFYARFGFEVRATLRPLAEGPPLYSMWRAPRS
jgi:ribosomal protein S18 acetylase RimI-like enzyme